VYKIARSGQQWKETVLYMFRGGSDGAVPFGSLVLDRAGNIYGTTMDGGGQGNCTFEQQNLGCGTVFELTPSAGGKWKEMVLHRFGGGNGDGANPLGGLVLDTLGNVYGVTPNGGSSGDGTIFELVLSREGHWTEKLLHNFTGPDGRIPQGVTLDETGNLYGAADRGGAYDLGAAFELSPGPGGEWSETVIYNFAGIPDGAYPDCALVFQGRNLYGLGGGGGDGFGTAFELKPNGNGGWTEAMSYKFTGGKQHNDYPPNGPVVFDKLGNFYGSISGNRHYAGNVFELSNTSGIWKERVLHTFSGGKDGEFPSAVLIDEKQNLYGVVEAGGSHQLGFMFRIQP